MKDGILRGQQSLNLGGAKDANHLRPSQAFRIRNHISCCPVWNHGASKVLPVKRGNLVEIVKF